MNLQARFSLAGIQPLLAVKTALILAIGLGAFSYAGPQDDPSPSDRVLPARGETDQVIPNEPDGVEAPAHQVWLISSRHLGCNSCADASSLRFWVYDGKCKWIAADLETFLAGSDPNMPTSIYVHGNQIDRNLAVQLGWNAYRKVVKTQTQPTRFVIWSWPSDKIRGLFKDVRSKAARSDRDAYYLAQLLSQLPEETRLSLIGYSFGGRISSGALHLINGGQIGGTQLAVAPTGPANTRLVLLAPAMHNDWLLPGCYHGHALDRVDRMLVLYNSCDRALKHYRLISRHSNPQALGYTGLVGLNRLTASGTEIAQKDACCIVGRDHNSLLYFGSPELQAIITDFALGDGEEVAIAADR